MARDTYDEDVDVGDYEKTAADYDDARPEESLQSRIAMMQAARKSSMSTAARRSTAKAAAQKAAPPISSRPIDDQGREGMDRGFKPPIDQGREGMDRGFKPPISSRPIDDQGREGMDRGFKRPVDQGREGRDRGTSSYAKGGAVSASRRADGCAQRGKTRGRMI